MKSWIDGTLYPDVELPREINTIEDQIDFVARLCSAWDFGILPESETIQEIRRTPWRDAIDQCQLLTSPTYHLLREWHRLSSMPYLGQDYAYIRDDPNLAYI